MMIVDTEMEMRTNLLRDQQTSLEEKDQDDDDDRRDDDDAMTGCLDENQDEDDVTICW